jgi:hypothetical protein
MDRNRILAFMVAAAIVATGASLWALGADQKQVRIPVPAVHSVDGATLYAAYCASCHGPAGKGNGPVSGQLNHTVPDLTLIADRDRKFDASHVFFHIRDSSAASDLMPSWHSLLRENYYGNPSWAYVATSNLARHIQTLQVTTVPANNRRD